MPKTKDIIEYDEKTFEDIKHIDECGNEYWEARELQVALDYSKWENFYKVIDKAKTACSNSKNNINEHFPEVRKTLEMPNNASKVIVDFNLSRYACYLIVQNADPRKSVIALGQTYFAVQTRKQELTEQEYNLLTEEEKRLYKRNKTRNANYSLQQVASKAGVRNMDQFHNAGYKGLYNGETADDIFKRKGLRYREDILDNMGSEELVANEFRIVQTEAKLKRENIKGEKEAKDVHYEIGTKVRKAIVDMGGTMPEKLPTPKKSLKELKKEEMKKLISNK